MILVNTDYISGKKLETLSIVKGSTIHSKHIGKDIAQSFKTLVGGELKAYNDSVPMATVSPNCWKPFCRSSPWTPMWIPLP